jgi:hypothetical protein
MSRLDIDRPGWTRVEEHGTRYDHESGHGYVVPLLIGGAQWEVGYERYSYRDGPEWVWTGEGEAPTIEEAMAAVEWVVAVADAHEAAAEAEIDNALLLADAARDEYERREAAGEFDIDHDIEGWEVM